MELKKTNKTENETELELLQQIIDAYKVITGTDENFEEWANEPNDELDGFSPAELFDLGKAKIIIDKLEELINNGGT